MRYISDAAREARKRGRKIRRKIKKGGSVATETDFYRKQVCCQEFREKLINLSFVQVSMKGG
jgi:hypothetical protein